MRLSTISFSIFALSFAIAGLNGCAASDESADRSATSNNAVIAQEPAAAAFLEASTYSNLLRVDPSFPFGVTGKHATNGGAALGARWGRHGGPSVTTGSFSPTSKVLRYSINRDDATTAPTADATSTTLAVANASSVPAQKFWGADGLVDLPFGELAMQAYTTSGAAFGGEIFFYKADYETVTARANVNGFYSGIGISQDSKNRIVYSGLSGISTSASTVSESGLWAADVCNDSLAAAGCSSSFKLFGWSGFSGPVTQDASGNVFVAAYVTGGAESDLVYGLTTADAFATAPLTPATVARAATNGTASIAAASTPGSNKGWLLGKGYDGETPAPVWAQAYSNDGTGLAANGAALSNVIAPADSAAVLSLFTDDRGRLWVALETPDAGSWLFELDAK